MMIKVIRGKACAAQPLRRRAAAMAVAAALASFAGGAYAFEIDTGNPDISMRWDNTFRYNLGMRVEGRDQNIGNYFLADEGTYSFDKNKVVTNRLDVLSEFDFVWRKSLGFRVSAAGWYDNAYDGKNPVGNPNLVVPPAPAFGPFPPLRQALPNGGQLVSYDNGEYSPYVKRYYAGPSGELLDAFVFANFDAGNVPVSVNGLGIREQLHALLLQPLGIPREAAVAISLLLFGHAVLSSVFGFVLWVRMPALPVIAPEAAP